MRCEKREMTLSLYILREPQGTEVWRQVKRGLGGLQIWDGSGVIIKALNSGKLGASLI